MHLESQIAVVAPAFVSRSRHSAWRIEPEAEAKLEISTQTPAGQGLPWRWARLAACGTPPQNKLQQKRVVEPALILAAFLLLIHAEFAVPQGI